MTKLGEFHADKLIFKEETPFHNVHILYIACKHANVTLNIFLLNSSPDSPGRRRPSVFVISSTSIHQHTFIFGISWQIAMNHVLPDRSVLSFVFILGVSVPFMCVFIYPSKRFAIVRFPREVLY